MKIINGKKNFQNDAHGLNWVNQTGSTSSLISTGLVGYFKKGYFYIGQFS